MKRGFVICMFLLTVLSVMAENEKLRIAVFDPDSKGTAIDEGTKVAVREIISSTLVNTGKYEIVERSLLEKVMKEQQFSQSGAVDDSQITEIGKLAGANKVIVSVVTLIGGRNMLSVKMIDVKTASVDRQKVKVVTSGGLIDVVEPLTLELVDEKSGNSSSVSSAGIPSVSNTSVSSLNSAKMDVSGKDFIEEVNGVKIKMVYVEGGHFNMGATPEQGTPVMPNEKPVHQVTVNSFYIGAFEVTQVQWEKIMGVTLEPDKYKYGHGSDYPMYYVSWEDAVAFCHELSRMTGKTFRLPTEAEWEYAARGGKHNEGVKYSGSMSADVVAWHRDNSEKSSHPVGTKRANALGIYDMSGNVFEWCQDNFVKYKNIGKEDKNRSGGFMGQMRVLRGGCWKDALFYSRVSFRGMQSIGVKHEAIGFRVVMMP